MPSKEIERWFVGNDGELKGPYTLDEIRSFYGSGKLQAKDPVYQKTDDKKPLGLVVDLLKAAPSVDLISQLLETIHMTKTKRKSSTNPSQTSENEDILIQIQSKPGLLWSVGALLVTLGSLTWIFKNDQPKLSLPTTPKNPHSFSVQDTPDIPHPSKAQEPPFSLPPSLPPVLPHPSSTKPTDSQNLAAIIEKQTREAEERKKEDERRAEDERRVEDERRDQEEKQTLLLEEKAETEVDAPSQIPIPPTGSTKQRRASPVTARSPASLTAPLNRLERQEDEEPLPLEEKNLEEEAKGNE